MEMTTRSSMKLKAFRFMASSLTEALADLHFDGAALLPIHHHNTFREFQPPGWKCFIGAVRLRA
jgi:hypothetical protein